MREPQAMVSARPGHSASGLSASANARRRVSATASDDAGLRDGERDGPAQDRRVPREHEGLRALRQALSRGRAIPLSEGPRAGEQGHAAPGLVPRADARDAVQEGRAKRRCGEALQIDRLHAHQQGRISTAEGQRQLAASKSVAISPSIAVDRVPRADPASAQRRVQGSHPEGAGATREPRVHLDEGEPQAQQPVGDAAARSRARDHGARRAETKDQGEERT